MDLVRRAPPRKPLSRLFHSYFMPRRWSTDFRIIGFAAHVRDGRMSRDEALALMEEPPHLEQGLLEYYKKRLGLTTPSWSG